MAGSLDTLEHGALPLSEEQRLTLAHRLLKSTEPVAAPSIDSLWTAEIVRRIEAPDTRTTGPTMLRRYFVSSISTLCDESGFHDESPCQPLRGR